MTNPEISAQESKLAGLLYEQTLMKAINTAYVKYKKDPNSLVRSGLSDAAMNTILNYRYKGYGSDQPHPSWELTNLSATIRNTKKRIEELQKRVAEAELADGENKVFKFVGGVVIYNYDAERLQIDFDQKPEQAMIDRLKSNGYKWSPTNGVWQRQLTDNARHNADYLFSINTFSPEAVAEREANRRQIHCTQDA